MPSKEEWEQLHKLRENLDAAREETEGGDDSSSEDSGNSSGESA